MGGGELRGEREIFGQFRISTTANVTMLCLMLIEVMTAMRRWLSLFGGEIQRFGVDTFQYGLKSMVKHR